MMKGVILAGGLGTRLRPITLVTNKHLLPVYNKPMIYYPLQTLVESGIKEIMVVAGPEYSGDFLNLLRTGKNWGVKINFEIQQESLGIAHALGLAEDFADSHKIAVILGDNLFENNKQLARAVSDFNLLVSGGAKVFLKEREDAERFGVAFFDDRGKIKEIVEKPENPSSRLAVTGFYLYDSDVFSFIKTLKLSRRGQYELTDVNNIYLKKGEFGHEVIDGEWFDCGTFDSLRNASNFIAEKYRRDSLV